MSKRITPFHSGEQDIDWGIANCDRCKKGGRNEDGGYVCDIQTALQAAFDTDGTVSEEIARRMGYFDHGESGVKRNWCCNEVVWTDEWKAAVNAGKTKDLEPTFKVEVVK